MSRGRPLIESILAGTRSISGPESRYLVGVARALARQACLLSHKVVIIKGLPVRAGRDSIEPKSTLGCFQVISLLLDFRPALGAALGRIATSQQ